MDCPDGYVRVVSWDQGEDVFPVFTHVACAASVGPEHKRGGDGIMRTEIADRPECLCAWCGGRIPDPPHVG